MRTLLIGTLFIVLTVLGIWMVLGEHLPVAKNFWVLSLLFALFLFLRYLIFLLTLLYTKAIAIGFVLLIISSLLGIVVLWFPENQITVSLGVLLGLPLVASWFDKEDPWFDKEE